MSKSELLKKLLPGFIPLFAFIAIDEIWGTRAGLVAALIIGVGEMVWIWIKEKRFDKFVLFDTGLLVVLGSVSLILDNDIFFKLKPGLVELILRIRSLGSACSASYRANASNGEEVNTPPKSQITASIAIDLNPCLNFPGS